MSTKGHTVQKPEAATVEWWPAERVIPYARNPRTATDTAVGKVAASIKEFGFRVPIIVDGEGVIIAGHTRLAAAQRLGLERVPVLVAADLSPAQVKAYRIADNRTGQEAGWQTVQFNAFQQWKETTQHIPGGNTEEFYRREGTLPKSQMLARMHPDVARVVWKFGRWHHYVDYSAFKRIPLIKRKDAADPEPYPYRLRMDETTGWHRGKPTEPRPAKTGTEAERAS